MNNHKNFAVQYVNIVPGKKIVSRDEMATYEFKNLDRVTLINVDPDMAMDYLFMIIIDKMLTTLGSIKKAALIRSNLTKYPGFQLLIEGDIRADKSLIPRFISWEKVENHQRVMDDLLPLYEE